MEQQTERVITKSIFKRNETPYISLQKGNSTVFLSAFLSRFLALTEGDFITLHKHKVHKFCNSISIGQDPMGAAKLSVPASGMWRFNDIDYVNFLCETYSIGKKRVRLYIDTKNILTNVDGISSMKTTQYQIIDIPMQRFDLSEDKLKKYEDEYVNAKTKI